jgi:23S rRNA (adenine-N6)-dimethyltransferase
VAVRRQPARGSPGRHFLRSNQLAADLVSEAGVASGNLVIEIGGGRGVLTQALARAEAQVVVVELDPALAAELRTRFSRIPTVEIVRGDAGEHTWPNEAFAVVANLPFARCGAILAHLLRDPRVPLRSAHVIVQWEFAAKHAAVWPSTLRSTYWRAWYDISISRRLARTAFSPPPAVDAAVLRLERRDRPRVAAGLHEPYRRFLTAAFSSQKPIRRLLRPSLTPLQIKRLAPVLGLNPEAHAWDLDAEQWARLFTFARARDNPQ